MDVAKNIISRTKAGWSGTVWCPSIFLQGSKERVCRTLRVVFAQSTDAQLSPLPFLELFTSAPQTAGPVSWSCFGGWAARGLVLQHVGP